MLLPVFRVDRKSKKDGAFFTLLWYHTEKTLSKQLLNANAIL